MTSLSGLALNSSRGKTQLEICDGHGHLSEPNANFSVGTGYLKQGNKNVECN